MPGNWLENVRRNRWLVKENAGPRNVVVVTGTPEDQNYWGSHFNEVARDLFREDGDTFILPVWETLRKGNFLGTINAWQELQNQGRDASQIERDVTMVNMVFGEGRRLSPFTQALGNRKPAFPTPLKSLHTGIYLNLADLSSLYTNLWIYTLRQNGFSGAVIKWGDEAIIPGLIWPTNGQRYCQYDAVRFVWRRELTEDLAREKEWVAIDSGTEQVVCQFSRQPLDILQERIAEYVAKGLQVGVNLGSLAIGHKFLQVALKVLQDDLRHPQKWVDWDPYVWMALHCRDEQQWQRERQHEARIGKTGIAELEARYPDFYPKMSQIRRTLEEETGRPFSVGVLDFGEPFWVDFGLHIPLRSTLETLLESTERGEVARSMFDIPSQRDRRGNIIVRSQIPPAADIRDSLIMDSVIEDERSLVRRGLILGSRHQKLWMPHGGSSLFCAVRQLTMRGPHAIAFWTVGESVELSEGDRCTTLLTPAGPETMLGNEEIKDYRAGHYNQPILDNRYSFDEAARLMAGTSGKELEMRWANLLRPLTRQ